MMSSLVEVRLAMHW